VADSHPLASLLQSRAELLLQAGVSFALLWGTFPAQEAPAHPDSENCLSHGVKIGVELLDWVARPKSTSGGIFTLEALSGKVSPGNRSGNFAVHGWAMAKKTASGAGQLLANCYPGAFALLGNPQSRETVVRCR